MKNNLNQQKVRFFSCFFTEEDNETKNINYGKKNDDK